MLGTLSIEFGDSRLTPNFRRRLEHHVELAKLLVFRQQIAAEARREAALRTDRQLFQRQMARCVVDAAAQLIDGFNPANLGRDQTQHGDLALRYETKRVKIPCTLRVVFQ